jgi:uncharacterized protein YjiS (DUF1127 family)
MTPRGAFAPALLLTTIGLAVRRFNRCTGRGAEVAMTWLERSRQRRQLGELNDHLLRDIGASRADAWAEAAKPFWRP